MKKDEIIEELQGRCETEHSSNGYAQRSFYIHMKKSDSFQVRKGNYLEWDDDEFLVISFTREINETITNKAAGKEGFWGVVGGILETMGDSYALSKRKAEEIQNAKKIKIKWYSISDVG